MRVTLDKDLNEIVELDMSDIAKLFLGREIKIPGHAVRLRNQIAFEAFNLSARPDISKPLPREGIGAGGPGTGPGTTVIIEK
jgi:hypothetical protein